MLGWMGHGMMARNVTFATMLASRTLSLVVISGALALGSGCGGMSERVSGSAYEEARESWGFPRFAADFPRHEELDALVVAFARGEYATVRERAPVLAKRADDEAVRRSSVSTRCWPGRVT